MAEKKKSYHQGELVQRCNYKLSCSVLSAYDLRCCFSYSNTTLLAITNVTAIINHPKLSLTSSLPSPSPLSISLSKKRTRYQIPRDQSSHHPPLLPPLRSILRYQRTTIRKCNIILWSCRGWISAIVDCATGGVDETSSLYGYGGECPV